MGSEKSFGTEKNVFGGNKGEDLRVFHFTETTRVQIPLNFVTCFFFTTNKQGPGKRKFVQKKHLGKINVLALLSRNSEFKLEKKNQNFSDGKDHFWKTKRVKGLINVLSKQIFTYLGH